MLFSYWLFFALQAAQSAQINRMKRAWKSGIKASADYYDRMSQYNKDTRNMSKEERNRYYRDRNKEDGWFDENNN